MQRGARDRVPQVPGPVREDEGARDRVPVLRAPEPAGAVPVPAEAGVGEPRRAHRTAPSRVRGERGASRVEPVRSQSGEDLLEGGERESG